MERSIKCHGEKFIYQMSGELFKMEKMSQTVCFIVASKMSEAQSVTAGSMSILMVFQGSFQTGRQMNQFNAGNKKWYKHHLI